VNQRLKSYLEQAQATWPEEEFPWWELMVVVATGPDRDIPDRGAAPPPARKRPDPERELPPWLEAPTRRGMSAWWTWFFLAVGYVAVLSLFVRWAFLWGKGP